jgi:hypothetical protein
MHADGPRQSKILAFAEAGWLQKEGDIHQQPLVQIFARPDWKTTSAYFWDSLRDELPAWANLEYQWIASSAFGDQIIVIQNSPIHDGPVVYMHGPDVSGPQSDNPNWPDNILVLGFSVDEWLARIQRFGDEFSVVPGHIDELLEARDDYRKIYRDLNPGLIW